MSRTTGLQKAVEENGVELGAPTLGLRRQPLGFVLARCLVLFEEFPLAAGLFPSARRSVARCLFGIGDQPLAASALGLLDLAPQPIPFTIRHPHPPTARPTVGGYQRWR